MTKENDNDAKYPSTKEILHSPISVLLYSRGLELFDHSNLQRVVQHYETFTYPDGTLEILCDDNEMADRLYKELPVYAVRHQALHFRNLLGFPLRRYYLEYRKTYEDKMRDVGIGLGTGVLIFFPGEWHKENLQFTVIFYRKPTKRTTKAFVEWFSRFFSTVKTSGVDLEGPLLPVKPVIKLRGNRAEIWLDASRTGPRTLVWILLEAFGFGHDVALVERALFDQDDEANVQRWMAGAKRASVITGTPWTEEYQRRLLEDSLGGFGEKEIELSLIIK